MNIIHMAVEYISPNTPKGISYELPPADEVLICKRLEFEDISISHSIAKTIAQFLEWQQRSEWIEQGFRLSSDTNEVYQGEDSYVKFTFSSIHGLKYNFLVNGRYKYKPVNIEDIWPNGKIIGDKIASDPIIYIGFTNKDGVQNIWSLNQQLWKNMRDLRLSVWGTKSQVLEDTNDLLDAA